jgi:hypothetical protein
VQYTPRALNGWTRTLGIGIAQVRLIFRLTADVNREEVPLLYVHWFKPLRNPIADLEMYNISFSSHLHQTRASVIPASDLIASCHLIPKFGKEINPAWTADKVLDQAPSFYLNPYLRHYDFYVLRYLWDQYKFDKRSPPSGNRVGYDMTRADFK